MNDEENFLEKKKTIDIVPMEDLMPMGNPIEPELNKQEEVVIPEPEKTEPIVEDKPIKEENEPKPIVNDNLTDNAFHDSTPVNNTTIQKPETKEPIVENKPSEPINEPKPIVNNNQTTISQPVIEQVSNTNTSSSNNIKTIIIIVVLLIAIAGGIYYILNSGPSKTLVCTQSGLLMENEMSITTKNDRVKKINVKMTYDFSSFSDDVKEKAKKEDSCKDLQSSYDESFEYTNCHKDISGDKIIITTDMKVKGDNTTSNENISNFREYMEKSGYSCSYK